MDLSAYDTGWTYHAKVTTSLSKVEKSFMCFVVIP